MEDNSVENMFDRAVCRAKEGVENFLLEQKGLGKLPLIIAISESFETAKKLRGALHFSMLPQDRARHPLRINDPDEIISDFTLTINPPNF